MSCIDDIHREVSRREGDAFTARDFLAFGEYAAVRQALSRLAGEGSVRRVLRGVYDRPRYVPALRGYAAPFPRAVALALARRHGWDVCPLGEAALHILGLSPLPPPRWEYASSGPYREYQVGGCQLAFRHRAPALLAAGRGKARLVLQILLEPGSRDLPEAEARRLAAALGPEERAKLAEGAAGAPRARLLLPGLLRGLPD